jgi:hypothetical protein
MPIFVSVICIHLWLLIVLVNCDRNYSVWATIWCKKFLFSNSSSLLFQLIKNKKSSESSVLRVKFEIKIFSGSVSKGQTLENVKYREVNFGGIISEMVLHPRRSTTIHSVLTLALELKLISLLTKHRVLYYLLRMRFIFIT